jgi:hypothetical protein
MTAEAEPVPAITACSLVLCLAKSTSCSTQCSRQGVAQPCADQQGSAKLLRPCERSLS